MDRDRFAALDIFKVFADRAALFGADVIDEKTTMKMIDLMQNSAAEQATRIEFKVTAFQCVRVLTATRWAAGNVERQARETKAAFVADDLSSWSVSVPG